MEKIIEDMITSAYRHKDYEMAAFAYQLMAEMARTFNCPSNWQDIGENMADSFSGVDWIEDNCKLYDFR